MGDEIAVKTAKPSIEKPWLKYYRESAIATEFPKRTIYRTVMETCEKMADETALYYYGSKVSYKKLGENINKCADAYFGMGIRPGDILSFCSVATPETIYSLYALNKLGAIANFIDPRTDAEGIFRIINEVGSKVLVTLDIAWPKIERIRHNLKNIETIIVLSANTSLPTVAKIVRGITDKSSKAVPFGGNIINWKQFSSFGKGATCPEHPYEDGCVCAITHTGGTTGFPKGVMLTSDGLNAVLHSFEHAGFEFHAKQKFLNIIPIFASYGIVVGVHVALGLGLVDVLVPKFTPATLGALIKKYEPNHMIGVPAFYEAITEHPQTQDMEFSFVGMWCSGGDTMNEGMEAKLNGFICSRGSTRHLAQGYGMSEVSAPASVCFDDVYKTNSSGIPILAATISVFEPGTTNELGYGEQGEICITGPTMMKGYFNKPEETAHVMVTHPDGNVWVHSGDIGYMDEDGFIYIINRIKHMIIRFDGHKVFPIQIESVLQKHDKVAIASVIGIPDASHGQGEVPLAVIELNDADKETADKEALRVELMTLAYANLEERGRPADVVFIDTMPLTAMGKIDHIKLTEIYYDHNVREFSV